MSIMIKPIPFWSIFTVAAVAQSNTLIPSGISPPCSAFFTKLDSDSSLRACTRPLIDASAGYGPSSNLSNPATVSSMTSALDTLCSSLTTSGCTDSLFRCKIAEFYGACASELTSTLNEDVMRTYDVLYTLLPMRQAICSKDGFGRYCVTETVSNVGHSKPKNLTTSGPPVGNAFPSNLCISTAPTTNNHAAQTALYPNTTTYSSTNLLFLFLSPDLPKEKLCVPCTRSVVASYTNFESSVPYAPGLPNSPFLKSQPQLYEAIRNTCGKSFMSDEVHVVGGISSSALQGGASRNAVGESKIAVFLGTAALGALGLIIVL